MPAPDFEMLATRDALDLLRKSVRGRSGERVRALCDRLKRPGEGLDRHDRAFLSEVYRRNRARIDEAWDAMEDARVTERHGIEAAPTRAKAKRLERDRLRALAEALKPKKVKKPPSDRGKFGF